MERVVPKDVEEVARIREGVLVVLLHAVVVEDVLVVLERVLLAIVLQNVMGAAKTALIVGIIVAHRAVVVMMSVRVTAMMFVPVHAAVIVLEIVVARVLVVVGVVIVDVLVVVLTATPIVLVPPNAGVNFIMIIF